MKWGPIYSTTGTRRRALQFSLAASLRTWPRNVRVCQAYKTVRPTTSTKATWRLSGGSAFIRTMPKALASASGNRMEK